MANKNKRTKARRKKEVKEAQHQKVVEKPIYKRPWIWIALVVLVLGITVPSALQHNEQVKEEAKARQAREDAVWDSVLTPLDSLGITTSAIADKSFDVRLAESDDTYDTAQVTIATDVRTVVASCTSSGAWQCTQVANEDGSHVYWSFMSAGAENATQAAVMTEDGSVTMAAIYDYATDEPVPDTTTGAAVEQATDAETTGAAADEPDEPDEADAGAGDEATGAAAE
jgi:hypothetical protein